MYLTMATGTTLTTQRSLEAFCLDAHPKLVAALAHHTGNRWLAEELAQEALIRACERWDREVSNLQSPIGWTFRVGVNLSRSYFRRRAAERRANARSVEGSPHVVDHDDALTVRAALADLPARQREVVLLRFFLGLSSAEAGAVLGMSPGAVRVLTHRAVEALRGVLDLTPEDVITDAP